MAVQIPTIDGPGIRQRGVGVPQVRAQPVDDSMARLGSQVLSQADQLFQKSREDADTAAVLQADNQLTQWQQSAFYDEQNGVYSKKGQNALNITNQTLGSFDQQTAAISQNLNATQKARFAELAARKRQGLNADLNQWEYRQREQYYNDVDKGQIETSMQGAALAYQNPAEVAGYKAKIDAVLVAQARRTGASAESLQANRLAAGSSVESAVIGRMVTDNPYKARDYFKQAQAGMTADDQIRAANQIEREIKSREIEARQMQAIVRSELSSSVQDASAAYLQGLDYEGAPGRAEFVAAYGAEEGGKRFSSFQRLQQVSTSIRDLATAAPEERMQILQSFRPDQDGVASEGFREKAQVYGVLANAASSMLKKQQDDPAAYVSTYAPAVQAAQQAMENGGSPQEYAAASLAEQIRLGVQNPRLLSNAQAASIAAQFANTEDGGSNAARLIEQQQAQWGKYWPTVFKQLQNELPGSAMVIGTGVDGNTAARLARISGLNNEDLKRGLDSTASRDAREALNAEMEDFRATLNGQVGGDRTFATMYKEGERLMYSYMAEGVSAKDAATRVRKSFVDDKYTVRGTWRAPINLDADLIERGAGIIQNTINPADLAFTVPQGVSEEFANERVKTAIERDGQWVTLPDESGLALYYNGEAVLGKDGAPVTRSWDELTGTAADNPSVWDRFNRGRESQRANSQQGAWQGNWRRGQ